MSPLQRRENTDHTEHAAGDVDHRGTGAQRSPRRSGHIRESAHHLRNLVERDAILVWPAQEPLRGTIEQPRVIERDHVVSESQTFESTGAEIFDEDVHGPRQSARDSEASRRFQVQAYAALVAIVHREIAGAGPLERTSAVTTDRLDARHVRAEIGKY